MRALVLALILSVPLVAGEKSKLAQAVDKFGSNRAAEREAATHGVQQFLKKTLAPLLAAMKSDDPEVARRARLAFASMLPPEKEEKEEEPQSNAGGGQVFVFGGNKQQVIRLVMKGGKGAFKFVPVIQGAQQNKELKKFGVEGKPVTDALLRKQLGLALGRGFAVERVAGGTPAAALGLRQHDVVLSVNGKPVKNADEFVKALGAKKDWKAARAKVLRMGTPQELGGR